MEVFLGIIAFYFFVILSEHHNSWKEMIADGDEIKAKEYKDSHVHKLGNLTLSGYNSSLSTKSFKDKRDKRDKDGRYIGYKNGLDGLNKDLANEEVWTIQQIDKRTDCLAEAAVKLFSLDL